MREYKEINSHELLSNVGYGRFKLSNLVLNLGDFKISFKKEGVVKYLREGGGSVEKVVAPSEESYVFVNPVEPINLPKPISDFLLVELSKPVLIAPSASIEAYLTFPIEIGILLVDGRDVEVLDLLSLVRQKYVLYGTPRAGVVCRYWLSDVFPRPPMRDLLREGVLKLRVANKSNNWVTVSNVVLSAEGMNIYYDNEYVSTSAQMNVISPKLAETSVTDEPLRDGMSKSLNARSNRRISITRSKFMMEWGL